MNYRLSHDIENELKELICEILGIEQFELRPGKPFRLLGSGVAYEREIVTTVESAFGVAIDRADTVRMVDLEQVSAVLAAALAAKHVHRQAV